ncbi:MAG: glutathione S-transferase family protein [Hyphomicrobiaceae bacterium]
MAPASYKLVIGNKMWSSWSLRPWLLMRHFGIAFEEAPIRLRSPDTAVQIKAYSPSGKVPALIAGDLTVWDTLAIIEYLAEAYPKLTIWPSDGAARAIARSVSAEMHSGFVALRQNCPMDFTARGLRPLDEAAIAGDVARIAEIWHICRKTYGLAGPFLFGEFSAADAMYAPVVSRFVSYDVNLAQSRSALSGDDGVAAAYIDTMMALPGMAAWGKAAAWEGASL